MGEPLASPKIREFFRELKDWENFAKLIFRNFSGIDFLFITFTNKCEYVDPRFAILRNFRGNKSNY